jgi:hypothetical protein
MEAEIVQDESLHQWSEMPKAGERCPHSGLTRSMLNELILPTERNHFRPPLASKSLRKRTQIPKRLPYPM